MKNYQNNHYDVGFYVNPLEEDDVLNEIYLSQQVLPSLGYLIYNDVNFIICHHPTV